MIKAEVTMYTFLLVVEDSMNPEFCLFLKIRRVEQDDQGRSHDVYDTDLDS